MAVQRLYYADSSLREFTAKVVSCLQVEGGWAIALDATAFFPGGGGQACDIGTLNGAAVSSVYEDAQQIVHLCDRPISEGSDVLGKIDWPHRFDLMQQHSGEHIVSGIINRLFGYANVGFHIGSDVMTIDFDGILTYEDLQRVEALANAVIWENIPVESYVPGPEELPSVSYRSKRALPWPVRIVQIGDADCCACCGVHVKYTGQIGLVKLFSCVKFHSGVRIEIACGGRAASILSRVYEENRHVSQAFSAKILETGDAANRMLDQLSAEKYRRIALQKQFFRLIAERCGNKENPVYFSELLEAAEVRELADEIAKQASGVTAVFGGTDKSGYSFCLVSRSADVSPLGKQLILALHGRGGGKAGSFQGSLPATEANIRQILDICNLSQF